MMYQGLNSGTSLSRFQRMRISRNSPGVVPATRNAGMYSATGSEPSTIVGCRASARNLAAEQASRDVKDAVAQAPLSTRKRQARGGRVHFQKEIRAVPPRPGGRLLEPPTGYANSRSVFFVYSDVPGLVHQRHADYDRHDGHDDRVPQTLINIPRRSDDCRGQQRQHATEPAVADVIRQ
jgi:hypothetical protein